ncbi:unnamed protein product [Anisakis simplex]|nr:unnamed protein product [Anisakis simplex]
MAHAVITADQIRQMVYPHHQTVETSQTQSSATPQRNDNREDAIVDKVMNAGKGTVLDRVKLDKLVEQLDPTTLLEEDVKDALIQMVDDFVEQVVIDYYYY